MRKKSGCSMADIAKALNISPSTVSRALRSNPSISRTVTTKVLAEAQRQGYVCSKEKNIAIILPDSRLANYDTCMINELCMKCNSYNISWEITNYKNLATIKERLIHGLISLNYHDLNFLALTSNFNLPLVAINCSPNMMDKVYSISSNEEQGIFTALMHLKKLGHTNIIYLHSLSQTNYCSNKRLDACQKISQELKLNCQLFAISTNPENRNIVLTIIKEQIKNNFTAGIIEGENIGFVSSNFIQKNGIKIPEDFSLITWGMPDFSEHLYPSVTSLIQDFPALADSTIKTLLALWNGQSVPILNSVPYIFYEGESTKVLESVTLKE